MKHLLIFFKWKYFLSIKIVNFLPDVDTFEVC